jgi:hypothetical protein
MEVVAFWTAFSALVAAWLYFLGGGNSGAAS